jgi:uncharacterized protein (TIGR04255 family)
VPYQPYKRPPITEAVIEARFAMPAEPDKLNEASSDLASMYPLQEPLQNIDLQVAQQSNAQPTPQVRFNLGHKRTSQDVSQIVLLWPASILVSQLAPYPGWDRFCGRFVRDWAVLKAVTGYRKIARLGVRFVNRIDIPFQGEPVVVHSDYLNAYPQLPEVLGPLAAYSMQVNLPVSDIGCTLTINAASVPSPVLGHMSFVLDIDIGRDVDPPQNDEGIQVLLDQIRSKKNTTFEACITDRARELFQR